MGALLVGVLPKAKIGQRLTQVISIWEVSPEEAERAT